MTDQAKEECIYNIYQDLIKYSNEKIADLICSNIENNILINFILLQIKCKNTDLLQLMWYIFKKHDYVRDIINNSMIELLIASFDDSTTFFELFKWYEEFGYNSISISSNITTALYIQANKYPKLRSYLIQIINNLDNTDAIHNRTIFFIHDEAEMIKPYFPKDKSHMNRMIIRCYQYDAINTLKQIQYKNKIKFNDMAWYLLSPMCFNKHMEESKRNPYEDDFFANTWIEYVCASMHWDYLPLIINKLTISMWKVIKNYFYMGYLNITFVMVLIHQMKINNIPYEKLKSSKLKFLEVDYASYLRENNLYDYFANTRGLIVRNPPLKDNALETTVVSVTSMLVIFNERRIDALTEIIFDSSLNMSHKYKAEIKHVDYLLENNQLGWDEKTIKTYNNFKLIMSRIMDEADLSQDLVNKYNSFIPLARNRMPETYQLRYINHFLNLYKKITITKFKDEFKMIYDSCIELKQEYIKKIRKDTDTKLDHKILYVLPENPSIFDQFKNLIENSDCYDYSKDQTNTFWINELSDNKLIKNIVRNMLAKYHVPIQEIIPILYNYYSNYATEEHFFLE